MGEKFELKENNFDNLKSKLGDLENELQKLLKEIKPEDKLEVGNEFKVSKSFRTLSKKDFDKNDIVRIIDIDKKEGDRVTTTIIYSVNGDPKHNKMSKKIFIGYFCTIIYKNQFEYNKKLSVLKRNIEQLKSNLKRKNNYNKSKGKIDKIKEKVKAITFFLKNIKGG